MSKPFPALMAMAATLLLAACATPLGPVEVTRFHLPDTAALGHGTVALVPGPGADGASLEQQSYQAAVADQLARLGYAPAPADSAGQIATVSLTREVTSPPRTTSPVSVGLGGSTGSYGSGLGLSLGFNLSPKPADQVTTRLAVTIRDRAGGQTLWEGRSQFTVPATSPYAATGLAARQLARALFATFPGTSGETVTIQPEAAPQP
ncbi:MAG: DUF4136 domain-containing protein [Proteobacteria bacterium]|nr:DUF4136 domain-containing protein [Pseudomonadota bacterium]